ncbi:MAG: bifunctional adenosylcobinamide kinase/adenosylcobinamide-phosphate guanylyltransferase [Candidatus Omnitrophota bacterium]|nr:bifunctional adenosylcobinamide kinase/adenosylcobinamide-phosphate guanylyltransferase [Candidatus Omnitrophota bacterium]
MISSISLITGGVRSGKSAYALDLAKAAPGRKGFLATAESIDDEMELRIRRHRAERGDVFETVEESLRLASAIMPLAERSDFIVVDCITVWINNLLHHFLGKPAAIESEIESLLDVLNAKPTNMIIVTNEVGLGVMPVNALARQYAELLGKTNQRIAAISDQVIMMISGIPQKVKDATANYA